MNSEETTIITNIIQKIIILAIGAPSTAQFRTELLNLHKATGNWEKISTVVDDYMNNQIPFTQHGVSGLVQMIALNGFSLKFSDNEAEHVTNKLIQNGINSWSKLFKFAIGNLPADLGTILDYRAVYAEIFTQLLSEFNKEHGYYHTYSMSAAQEWLQGSNVFNGSSPEAYKSAMQLINKMVNGSITGRVLNGYLRKGVVFIDLNENNVLDFGEPSTTTDTSGKFLLTSKFSEGAYKAIGGIDIATGMPFPFTLTAPEGSVMLTPLTTLTALILHNNLAENLGMAEEMLFRSLDIPQVDLSVYDHIDSAIHSDNFVQQIAAVNIQAAIADIINFFSIAYTLANHFVADNSASEQIILDILVKHLVNTANSNQKLDLSNPETEFAMLRDIAIARNY